jgi:hypothetical protein
MRGLLLAIVAGLLVGAPLWAEEAPPAGTSVSDYVAGKLPPIETGPAEPVTDPDRFVEEPPSDIPFVPWSDWVVHQRISPLRRFFLETSIGRLSPSGGNLIANGLSFGYSGSFNAEVQRRTRSPRTPGR